MLVLMSDVDKLEEEKEEEKLHHSNADGMLLQGQTHYRVRPLGAGFNFVFCL